jgi:hypothetical protein
MRIYCSIRDPIPDPDCLVFKVDYKYSSGPKHLNKKDTRHHQTTKQRRSRAAPPQCAALHRLSTTLIIFRKSAPLGEGEGGVLKGRQVGRNAGCTVSFLISRDDELLSKGRRVPDKVLSARRSFFEMHVNNRFASHKLQEKGQ